MEKREEESGAARETEKLAGSWKGVGEKKKEEVARLDESHLDSLVSIDSTLATCWPPPDPTREPPVPAPEEVDPRVSSDPLLFHVLLRETVC